MLHDLTLKKDARTFSISPENPTGEKGGGGRATLETGTAAHMARELGVGWKVNPYVVLPPHETATLADYAGEGVIKHVWLTDDAQRGRQLLLRIFFDGAETPAVLSPLSDFFANADNSEYRQLSSLAMCYNPGKAMNCYFEMPFRRGFRVEVENRGETPTHIYYQIDGEETKVSPDALYFHAQFRRVNPLPYKEVHTILDGVTGRGQYVGTYLHWGSKSNGWWGEGEIKFYIDGDGEFPTVCGTGTEDYICGAYDFDVKGKYREFSTPYSGLSKVSSTDETYRSQRYFDMYRWHITDPVYFAHDLRVTIQGLSWQSEMRYLPLRDDISSVAYWYSDNLRDPYPPLPEGDALDLN